MDAWSPLLVGNKGMLGRAWQNLLDRAGVDYVAVDLDEMDLTDEDAVRAFVVGGRTPVINCAAYTNVDGAETDEELATRVNGHAVGSLARRCAEVGSVLVHYSTDYVFDGRADRPYPVDGAYAPVNAYGRGKAVGEKELLDSGCEHLLLRTSWVYAPWAKNFVRTIARVSKERDTLRVVADQRGRPSSAEHIADVSARLLRAGARGTFHVCDGGECTWHEFATEICRLLDRTCDVQPCTTADYPLPAKRPAYSVLDLEPTEAAVGPMRDWRENLGDVITRLEE